MASTLEPLPAPAGSLAPAGGTLATGSGPGVLGLGSALPEPVVGNDRVAARIGVGEEWILRRTGIRERRHAPPGAKLSELAAEAGRAALADAGLDAPALELLILATFTADSIIPPDSARVAHLLGAPRATTFDLNNACSGFIAGLATAEALIRAGGHANALVIGAEIISRRLDPGDRKTAAVFGDGAGAVVLGREAPGGFSPFAMGADGSQAHLITTDPASGLLQMDGHETFKQAVARMGEVTLRACAAADLRLGEIDLFVFHQANSRITATLGERLGLDPAKVIDCIATLGNTSAASIPLALTHARREGRLRAGQKVLLAAVGAGFTWGATVMQWKAR
ncbi:MAG TPA: beta-ketoacyl-ACP synthase 3 [Solirubrobacteraceae bacterium]|jgi:3-oxoacyl-[acyl-carrier-protein] synthase-3|nr:beta-ketoacyl-ACP synthase 3 [Solirubrobacteraceae bacterium]